MFNVIGTISTATVSLALLVGLIVTCIEVWFDLPRRIMDLEVRLAKLEEAVKAWKSR